MKKSTDQQFLKAQLSNIHIGRKVLQRYGLTLDDRLKPVLLEFANGMMTMYFLYKSNARTSFKKDHKVLDKITKLAKTLESPFFKQQILKAAKYTKTKFPAMDTDKGNVIRLCRPLSTHLQKHYSFNRRKQKVFFTLLADLCNAYYDVPIFKFDESNMLCETDIKAFTTFLKEPV